MMIKVELRHFGASRDAHGMPEPYFAHLVLASGLPALGIEGAVAFVISTSRDAGDRTATVTIGGERAVAEQVERELDTLHAGLNKLRFPPAATT
jgi:hypothetical protein